MIKLKDIYTESYFERYYYIGTCVNCFDESGNSLISQFDNVSDFAYEEENAITISREVFIKNVSNFSMLPNNKDIEYKVTRDKRIIMAYDPATDIHYFFGK
jgi:hypothetical protein